MAISLPSLRKKTATPAPTEAPAESLSARWAREFIEHMEADDPGLVIAKRAEALLNAGDELSLLEVQLVDSDYRMLAWARLCSPDFDDLLRPEDEVQLLRCIAAPPVAVTYTVTEQITANHFPTKVTHNQTLDLAARANALLRMRDLARTRRAEAQRQQDAEARELPRVEAVIERARDLLLASTVWPRLVAGDPTVLDWFDSPGFVRWVKAHMHPVGVSVARHRLLTLAEAERQEARGKSA